MNKSNPALEKDKAHYVYVLKMSNGELYIGFTHDLKNRLEQHKGGRIITTRKYLPVRLVYYECYASIYDAKQREKMIKKFGSTYSHLKNRILNSIK